MQGVAGSVEKFTFASKTNLLKAAEQPLRKAANIRHGENVGHWIPETFGVPLSFFEFEEAEAIGFSLLILTFRGQQVDVKNPFGKGVGVAPALMRLLDRY